MFFLTFYFFSLMIKYFVKYFVYLITDKRFSNHDTLWHSEKSEENSAKPTSRGDLHRNSVNIQHCGHSFQEKDRSPACAFLGGGGGRRVNGRAVTTTKRPKLCKNICSIQSLKLKNVPTLYLISPFFGLLIDQ